MNKVVVSQLRHGHVGRASPVALNNQLVNAIAGCNECIDITIFCRTFPIQCRDQTMAVTCVFTQAKVYKHAWRRRRTHPRGIGKW